MPHHQTFLRCSHRAAIFTITTSICLFILIGCASLFRSAGLSDEQAAAQTAQLKTALTDATTAAIADVQTGLAEGHDLKTIAVKASSTFIWKIIAAAGASVGILLNGLLAKWLGTERKMTAAMIGAVEHSGTPSVKAAIKNHATSSGVETKLHARVKALT